MASGGYDARESGGYDYEFVPELPDEYICVICQLALRKPKEIENCGHRFCESCFNDMKIQSNIRTEMLCPIDRQAFTVGQIFNGRGAERSILNWKIKCPNYEDGCEWVGELNYVKNHEKGCCYSREVLASEKDKFYGKKIQELEQAVAEQSTELLTIKEKFTKLEREFAANTEKLSSMEIQLNKFMEGKAGKPSNGESALILNSKDPRTINPISGKFIWSCPGFNNIDLDDWFEDLDNNCYSPYFYYNQHCFQLGLLANPESGELSITLFRVRGRFDEDEDEDDITDHLPIDFVFSITVRNIAGSLEEYKFIKKVWKISQYSKQSIGEKRVANSFYHNYLLDGYFHLFCEFLKK